MKKTFSILSGALLLSLVSLFVIPEVFAQGVVNLTPSSSTLSNVGDQVTVSVDVTGAIDSSAYEIAVEYDPTIVVVNSVIDGSFLSGLPINSIDNGVGKVTVSMVTFSGSNSGAGNLGSIVFEAVADGTTTLDVTKMAFTPAAGGDPVNATGNGGSITVSLATVTPTNAPILTSIPTDVPPSAFTSFFSPDAQVVNLVDLIATVELRVVGAPDSSSYEVKVVYDPTILSIPTGGVVIGDFLSGLPIINIDNALGEVVVSQVTFSGSNSGNGLLGTLTFDLVNSGNSPLTIAKSDFVPASGGAAVASVVQNGNITVSDSGLTNTPGPSCPRASLGDADCDGDIDVADYSEWFRNYDMTKTGPSFGDFNSDGKVDLIDYVIWYNNFDMGGVPTNPTITNRPGVTLQPNPSHGVTIIPSPTGRNQ